MDGGLAESIELPDSGRRLSWGFFFLAGPGEGTVLLGGIDRLEVAAARLSVGRHCSLALAETVGLPHSLWVVSGTTLVA